MTWQVSQLPGHVRIVRLEDPVLADAHPVGGGYVETYWLPVLGPTATWLARRLAAFVEDLPAHQDVDVDLLAVAISLGLSASLSANQAMAKSWARLGHFGVIAANGPTQAQVRTRLPDVPLRYRDRWPGVLRVMHDEAALQPARKPLRSQSAPRQEVTRRTRPGV